MKRGDSARGLRTRSILFLASALMSCHGQVPATAASVTVGGPFALTAPDGTSVTDRSYRGSWMLVYFGYTSCPDSCPTTLAQIAAALRKLGPAAANVRPIFITVDPQRDTREVLGNYTGSFDSRIIGLTGTPQQIDAVAREYGAYFGRHKASDGKASDGKASDGGKSYLMDHSIYLYLMDPEGEFARAFDTDWSSERIADTVRRLMAQYR